VSSRLRIAVFAPYLPAPLVTGGCLRIHHLSRALAAETELDLFARAPRWKAVWLAGDPALAPFARVTVRHDVVGPRLERELPLRAARGNPRSLRRAFRASHERRPYDAIVVAHSHASRTAAEVGLPWLLDEHNIESDYVAEAARSRGGRDGDRAGLERWERAQWTAASGVTCTSVADAERIAGARGRPPVIVPNGADVAAIELRLPSNRRSREVLFVGSMSHTPNVEAAHTLAREVMPRVWERDPAATLVLCGAAPSREVRALASSRVIVTGTVPSVRPFLERAGVYANALVHGAGSSLKVVEALAAGVPLVSTAAGARGHAIAPEGIRERDRAGVRRSRSVRRTRASGAHHRGTARLDPFGRDLPRGGVRDPLAT
jgi:polysaccharide biosynthesis protein PslH